MTILDHTQATVTSYSGPTMRSNLSDLEAKLNLTRDWQLDLYMGLFGLTPVAVLYLTLWSIGGFA